MNIKQFAALKPGDKIIGMLGQRGEVIKASDAGVVMTWEGSDRPYEFSVQSRAWTHWSQVVPITTDDLERHEGDLEDRARG